MILTHAWMPRKTHTAWAEIEAYTDLMRKYVNPRSQMICPDSVDEYLQCVKRAEPLTIFMSGEMSEGSKALLDLARENDQPVYAILQDPNWETDFAPLNDYEYTLITPFAALESKSDYAKTLKRRGFDVSGATRHVYFPFGEMALHSGMYRRMFENSREIDFDRTAPGVYAGSLKPDRAPIMAELAVDGLADLYGNINVNELVSHAPLMSQTGNIETHLKGKISPYAVWRAYAAYEMVYHIVDPVMVDLGVNCVRWFEYALANAKIAIVTRDVVSADIECSRLENRLIDDDGRASLEKLLENSDSDRIPDTFEVIYQ